LDDTPATPPPPRRVLTLHEVFAGSEGLRAGWGLLLFVISWQLLRAFLHPLVQSLIGGSAHTGETMTPAVVLAIEAGGLSSVAGSTWLLARVEAVIRESPAGMVRGISA